MFKIIGGLFVIAAIVILILSLAPERPGDPRPKLKIRKVFPVSIILLLIAFVLMSIRTVPAGHVGVITTFGKVSGSEVSEGMSVVPFWKKVHPMSVQTKELFQESSVPSKEGLALALETSLQYHIVPEDASEIYQKLGKNYEEKIIIPNFRSSLRNATTKYEAKALYTADRTAISNTIFEELTESLGARGIVIEKVLLRKVALPPTVQGAIESKLKAEQEAEAMQFILKKEEQEADRKRIEAEGIKDFQIIVRQGIDERLLKWKGIEATEALANSPNSKVVVIGGNDGMPLILNH